MESLTLTTKIESSSIFSSFELCGIAIAGIYFLIGFPANVLSIIVCFKSLFYRYIRRIGIKKKRKNQCKKFDTSFNNKKKIASTAASSSQHLKASEKRYRKNESEIILIESTKYRLNNNSDDKKSKHVKNNVNPRSIQLLKKQSNNGRVSLPIISTKNASTNFKQIEVNRANSSFNPHRKCFELYLIEISFCDLIIIGYNFLEWFLLILSKKYFNDFRLS